MNATLTILRRELGAYFNTPIGYVIIVAFLMLACALYVKDLFIQGTADMRSFFSFLPFLFLFFVPAVSMRLWAEERKLGTLELLLTFPLRTWQAVLGKFLAGMVFLGIMMALTVHLVLALWLLSPEHGAGLDYGPIIGGYLGAMVLGMVYLSVGSFASSLTGDQIVALVIGIVLNFGLYLIGYPDIVGGLRDFNPELAGHVQRFGVIYHFESISRGVVDSRDVIYAFSVCGFFLFLTHLVIERRR